MTLMTMMTTAMMMMKTLTGYCQCNKVCGSPLTYAGEGSHVVADPDNEHYDDCDDVDDNDDDDDGAGGEGSHVVAELTI